MIPLVDYTQNFINVSDSSKVVKNKHLLEPTWQVKIGAL